MPRPSLDEIRGVTDFATMYRWNLHFLKLPTVGFAGIVASNALNIRCESVELPRQTGQKITVNIRGHQVHQPGIYNYSGTLTVTFVETVDNTIQHLIKGWQEACWEPKTGTQKPKKETEGILLMELLNSDDTPRWGYKIEGVFLDDFDLGGTLDGASSDVIRPSLTFSFDSYTSAPIVA